MKGIVCEGAGGPEVLHYKTVDPPKLQPGTVLINVRATALNGADQLQMKGFYPQPPGASDLLGLEVSGVVSEGGGPLANSRVIALIGGGGYAEQALAPVGQVLPLPGNLTFEEGAAIPEVWVTAFLELVMLAGLKRGDNLLIHAGASGVGTAAIQIAKDIGARVFVTAGSQQKLDLCKELGADVLINYREQDFLELIREQTQGPELIAVPGGPMEAPGVNVILDLVGAAHFAKNLDALTVEGRLLLVGHPSGAKAEIDLTKVMSKRLKILGSTLRARPPEAKAQIVSAFGEYALPKFRSGQFRPVVDSVFPLAEARQAHERMAAHKNKGKIVLKVAD
eukprot:jgi/Botrbrau1/6190/Bobra.0344s0030.1